MDRSSRHALRAERISASPYKRPQSSGIKQSSSGTFSTVKNLFSYALSPLFRSSSSTTLALPSTTSDLPVEVEEKSESGSEDGWNGEPPSMTENANEADQEDSTRAVDLYDLAAAAGRSGEAFEERASQWRARGEIAGGRRDVARRILEGQPVPTTISAPASSSTPNGQINGTSDIAQSTAQKRPRSAIMTTPLKSTLNGIFTPTPSFLPPASGSPGSAALAAFLDAKKGSTMTAEDLRVIDSLTEHLHVEAGSPRQAGKEVQYGGWSAGMSPRVTKPIPGARGGFSTPLRSTFASPGNTPGSIFSVGTSTPLSASKASPYRVRYLGPGMSPKRMLGKQGGSGLKPLRHFDPAAEDSEESAAKKRRVDDSLTSDMDVEPEQPGPKSSLSQTVSLPDLASIAASPSALEKGKSKVGTQPHPLRQSTVATTEPAPAPKEKPDYVAKGKQRAANIIRELVEEQLAPAKAAKATGALTSDIVINPYDVSSSRTSTPPETRVFESPRKSTLRASVRGTPLRGAAAKLELHRSTGSKASTPSPVKSTFSFGNQSTTSAEKRPAAETPTTGAKEVHFDELAEDEDEVSTVASTVAYTKEVPRQPKEIKEPEPFKPYDVPVLDTPSRPIPSFASPSVSTFVPSPTATGAVQKPEEPAPKFTLTAPKPITPVEEDKLDIVATFSKSEERKDKFDASKIWLSAKDTVLAIAKPALPFFTFDPIKSSSKDDDDTKRAKEEALKASTVKFTFTFPSSSGGSSAQTSVPAPTPFQWPSGNGPTKSSGEWVCGTCMCKSPDAASKCVVCEEPRPKSIAAAPAPASATSTPAPAAKPFQWPTGSAPAKASTEWVCGTCMCKSPDSASKCVVCEEPRPKSTGAATAPAPAAPAPSSLPAPAPAPTPFQWPSGSAALKQSSDEWTCSTCMCKSPMSASKCVVCETPK